MGSEGRADGRVKDRGEAGISQIDEEILLEERLTDKPGLRPTVEVDMQTLKKGEKKSTLRVKNVRSRGR